MSERLTASELEILRVVRYRLGDSDRVRMTSSQIRTFGP
jgi:hypothetical protein